jgi:hypothetical protein
MNEMYSNHIRLSGLAAMLGGVMLTVHAIGVSTMPRGCIGDAECAIRPMRETGGLEIFFVLALPLILAGMAGLALRARQTGRFGRLGWTGVVAGVFGVATLVGAILAQAVFFGGDFSLMPFFVISGGLALIAGFALVGMAVLRTGVLPLWTSVLLVASTFAMLGFNDQNARVLLGVPFALAWVAAGYILWSGGRDATGRPEPTR